MQTQEYRYRDKSDWPAGPWHAEIDKRQWQDAETGLPCLIVRGPSGALCGYVGVAEGHPWHGVSYSPYDSDAPHVPADYESAPEHKIEVHGGLTFSAFCAEGDPEHGICHRPDPGEPEHVWWFGFDCAHYGDLMPSHEYGSLSRLGDGSTYRDIAYVEAECASLARQLREVAGRTAA